MPEIVVTIREKIAEASVRSIVCDNTDYTVRLDCDEQWGEGPKIVYFVLQGVGALAPATTEDDVCAVPPIRLSDGVGRQLAIGVQQGSVKTSSAAHVFCWPSAEDELIRGIHEDDGVDLTWLEWVNANMAQAEINVETAEEVLAQAQEAAETAEQARDDAVSAKTDAEAAAEAAESAKDGAETAKTAAQTAADHAAASASSAGTSAASAGSSAQTAETAKTAAQTAASQASASASTASSAATTATEAKNTAQTAAQTAETAAEAAESAKDGAETAKTAAQTAASQAAESASSAATSETSAGSSAQTAETAKTAAQTAASQAAASASSAGTSASSAGSSAQAAEAAKTAAQTAAQTAATKAGEASASAESVSASAAQIATNTDDIADLKTQVGDLKNDLYLDLNDQSMWVNGSIASSSGANGTSGEAYTIRTAAIPDDVSKIKILNATDYKYLVFAYTSKTVFGSSTYVGWWNGSEFFKSSPTADWILTDMNLDNARAAAKLLSPSVDPIYFRVEIRTRSNSGNIGPSECNALLFEALYKTPLDSTLTQEDMAADAKATGDAIGDLKTQLNTGKEPLFTDKTNWSNGYFSSIGTISSSSQSIVAMQAPYLWEAGKTITIDPDGLSADIITFSYSGSAYSRTGAETFTTPKSFTFQNDTYIGLQFKKIPQAAISPDDFTGTIETNSMIYDKVLKNESDISELENDISDLDTEIHRIATMDGGTVIDLLNEELETNKYWGNGGLISVDDPYKDYYAVGTLIPVEPGQNIVLKNMGVITNAAPAIIGMYDNDGQDAPGRVNIDSTYVISSIVEDDFIKEVQIKISDTATQIGLFFAVEKGAVVPGGITYTPECQLDNGSFAFSNEAEDAISEIVNDILDDTTIEAADIVADYYIKGESPKLERTKKLCIIGAGQSNIEGRVPVADLPDYITLPMPGMYMERNTTTGVFVNNYPSTSLWSFDLVTCYNLIQNLGTDNLYYIKWTQGGTSIDLTGDGSAHWTPDYETLAPQNALILQFNKEIEASIVNNPDDFEIGAMIWHQGESDRASYSQTAANNYYNNLKKVIAFCRGIAKNDCLPFICGTISENSAQYDATIDAAIRRIGNEDPYVYVIDMSNAVLLDNYHFNAAWSEYLGKKVYDALIDAKVITGTKINPSEPT